LSGRGLCDELITRPEESYRLCCVVVCDLETSRIGTPYIYDISNLRVKCPSSNVRQKQWATAFVVAGWTSHLYWIYDLLFYSQKNEGFSFFKIQWTNFQNCSSEVVPIVYTSGAENMSRGSVRGNFIAHSSQQWISFWEVAFWLLRTLSNGSPLTEVSADDGSPCTILSELMGSEIGFMRNLYRTPFCYFHIQTTFFFFYLSLTGENVSFPFSILIDFTHGVFVKGLPIVFRFDQYFIRSFHSEFWL